MRADELNRLLKLGERRADELSGRLARLLEPILEGAAAGAAGAFQARATDFLAAAAPAPTSCMVALYPRPEEAAALAQPGGEPAEVLHVTVCYVGDVPEEALPAIRQAAVGVAGQLAPLEGHVGGVGSFGPERHADGTMRGPSIVLPDVPGLSELRVAVTEALYHAGVDYARDHGFLPHITLSYAEGMQPPPESLVGLPLHFDALVLARGDVPDPIPFTGPAPATASALAAAGDPTWGMPAPDEVLDVDALVRELRTKTDPVRLAAIEAMMRAVLGRAGISFDVTNPFTARALASSGSQIRSIADTTRLNVMRIVRRSYEEGLSIPDTAKAIRAGMREATPARARLIARTEMAGAVNGGSLAASRIVARATGQELWKKWLTAAGASHPRHTTYMGLHGQVRTLDEPFSVGGYAMDYPGDHAGPPHESCNCRCTLVYTDDPEEAALAGQGPPAAGPPEAPVDASTLARIDELGIEGEPAKGPVARQILGDAADTEQLYAADNWAARRELHRQILRELFADKDLAAAHPTAFFSAGGAASGKSAATFRVGRKRLGLDGLRARRDTLVVDPDEIKALIPEYRRMLASRDAYAATAVHEESSFLARQAMLIAQQRRMNIALDGVGGSGRGVFVGKMHAARAAGYRVQVSMVSAPTSRAVERMVGRGDRTGRYVQMRALREGHRLSSARHLEWREADFIDRWTVWDNTGRPARLVAEGGGGRVRVYDREAYARILAKAEEAP